VALGRGRLLALGLDGGLAALFARDAAFSFLCFVVLFAHIVLLYFARIMPFVWRAMMKIWRRSFNIYLLGALAGLLMSCASGGTDKPAAEKDKKPAGEKTKKPSRSEASTIRFHYVINADGTDRCLPISVYRANPITLYIDRTPFLWEASITGATVTSNFGTYGLRLEFDRQGAITLQTFTTTFKSRHFAIFSDFGQSRWLAAPLVTRICTNGVFEFAPDASREETERIARGLNNLVRKSETYFDRRDRKQKEKEKSAEQPKGTQP
jgi:hypothetical protein